MYITANSLINQSIAPVSIKNQPLSKDFGESLSDAWDYTAYTERNISRQSNLHDELEKVVDNIKAKTGVQLRNPLRDGYGEFAYDMVKSFASNFAGMPNLKTQLEMIFPGLKRKKQQKEIDKFYKQANELADEYPDLEIPGYDELMANIKTEAQERSQRYYDGRENSTLGSFLGSAGAFMSDPINITSMFFGGGTEKIAFETVKGALTGLVKTAAIEGGVNMLSEAAIQPSVFDYKKELGLDYSAKEAVANVAMAGVGGAVLGTGIKVAGSLASTALSHFKTAKAKGVKFSPREKAAAEVLEQKIEFDRMLDETNPNADTLTGKLLHENKLKREYERLMYETEATGRAYDEVKNNPVGAKNDPLVILQPEDMDEVRIERGEYYPKKRTGYGLLKIEWKHGSNSTDAIPVTRDDIVRFPEIIRDYEPIERADYGNHRTWSVLRPDGKQVAYSDAAFAEDGIRRLVSIFVVDPRTPKGRELAGILSPKRNPQSGSEKLRSSTADTAMATFGRQPKSEGIHKIITPEVEQVKNGDKNISQWAAEDFKKWNDEFKAEQGHQQLDTHQQYSTPQQAGESLKPDDHVTILELQKRLEQKDIQIPFQEVDGRIETRSARELLQQYDKFDADAQEIAACILEFLK